MPFKKPIVIKPLHLFKYLTVFFALVLAVNLLGYFLIKEGRFLVFVALIWVVIVVSGALARFWWRRDITELRRLQEENNIKAKLLDAVTDSVFLVGLDGMIIDVNESAHTARGYTKEELLGMPLSLLDAPRYAKQIPARIEELMTKGEAIFQSEHMCKDSSLLSVEIMAKTIQVGGRVLVLSVARDITFRKQAETELLHSKEAAEAANRAKSQFLANMSHEIRTPMNAIMGLSHLILKTELTEKQHDYLEKIRSSTHTLLGVINDILDFSKIEAGRIEIEKIAFDLNDILDSITTLHFLKAEEKGLELFFSIHQDTPMRLVGDPLRLTQVLSNLASNAVKFTDKGKIVITAEPVKKEGPRLTLRFSVEDTGIGLTAEQKAKIFTPFAQADSSTRKYGGTGLGLTISKQLVELMGGTLTMKSAPGKGSVTSFTLDLEVQPAGAITPSTAFDSSQPLQVCASLKGVRVLVVEDDEISRQVAREILETSGVAVTIACSGQDAIEIIAASKKNFDAILMDLEMSDLDGYDTSSEIRKTNKEIPIIAMTAHALGAERQKCLDAGMNEYISKPVDPEQLFSKLAQYIKPVPVRRRPSSPPRPKIGARITESQAETLGCIDVQGALKRLGGNRELLAKLLRDFGANFAETTEQITTAIKENKMEVAQRLVHTLKGVAGNISATAVNSMARDLEEAMAKGEVAEILSIAVKLDHAQRALLETIANPLLLTDQPKPKASASSETPNPPYPARLAKKLAELDKLLAKNSMDAKKQFTLVREHMPSGAFQEEMKVMGSCMEGLDFKKARKLVATMAQKLKLEQQ